MTASVHYWWKTKRRETKAGLGLSLTTGDWGSLTLFVATVCYQESVRSTRCRLAGVNKHHHSLHSWSFCPGLPASLQAAPPHTVDTYSYVPLSSRCHAKLLFRLGQTNLGSGAKWPEPERRKGQPSLLSPLFPDAELRAFFSCISLGQYLKHYQQWPRGML